MSAWLPLPQAGLQLKNFHDEFLLLRRSDEAQALFLPALGQHLQLQRLSFVDEVIATEVEICIKLNERYPAIGLEGVRTALTHALQQTRDVSATRQWRLPIYFPCADAAQTTDDWAEIESISGLSREEAIQRLLRSELRLAMFGFLPGFAYLSGLPSELHIPRKHNPATRTARNAVALGGKYAGIYSLPSPAGWHVIGELGVNMLQFDALPPIAMGPGDGVRLERIDEAQLQRLKLEQTTLVDFNRQLSQPVDDKQA